MFVGDGNNYGRGSAPFSKSDPRLKNIPFVTRRPTVKEVQNVHSKLAALYEVSSEEVRHVRSSMMMKQKKQPSKTAAKEIETELTTVLSDGLKRSNEEGVHSDSGDEMEGDIDEVGGAIKTIAKRKKKRRAKKTTEPQGCCHPAQYIPCSQALHLVSSLNCPTFHRLLLAWSQGVWLVMYCTLKLKQT